MNKTLHACRDKAPGYRLAVLHRLSAAFLSTRNRALGLKRGWIGVLMEVFSQPGQSQDAICRSLRVDRAATARTLFELESQGYVLRREHSADRRQKLVFPTQKTLDLSERLFGVLDRHNQALFKGFDQQRREEALGLLAAMAKNLESALDNEES